jgi:hypothetical protein
VGPALADPLLGLAIRVHAENIRRWFLDPLTQEQATAIRAWSEQTVGRFEPRAGATAAAQSQSGPAS